MEGVDLRDEATLGGGGWGGSWRWMVVAGQSQIQRFRAMPGMTNRNKIRRFFAALTNKKRRGNDSRKKRKLTADSFVSLWNDKG
jgi:hypothetical protein